MKKFTTLAIASMIASISLADNAASVKALAPIGKKAGVEAIDMSKVSEMQARKKAMDAKAAAANESVAMAKTAQGNRVANGLTEMGVKMLPAMNGFRQFENTGFTFSGMRFATAGEVVDMNGIITAPAEGETKTYTRAGGCYYATSTGVAMSDQDGVVEITECEDGTVYIKDPVVKATGGSYVKGVKEGNTITVPAGQPVSFSSSYMATLSLRWGVVSDGMIGAADDHADSFTFTIDGDVISLEGTKMYDGVSDCYFMGIIWDDDDSFSCGDAETVWTYAPDYVAPVMVEMPADVETTLMAVAGQSIELDDNNEKIYSPYAGTVQVAQVEDVMYIKGLFPSLPEATIMGTVDGTTVTFKKEQWIGTYASSYTMYLMGYDPLAEELIDAEADIVDGVICFSTDLLCNAATNRVYYLDWLTDVEISELSFEAVELPYIADFENVADNAQMLVIDANGDGKTWQFAVDSESASTAARYTYNSYNAADDYLVVKPVKVAANTTLLVSLDARAGYASYPERVEVVCGTEAKAAALTTVVIEPTDLGAEYETLTAELAIAEEGEYFFAIHAISDPDMFYLYVDNFAIEVLDNDAPVAVANLVATPDANGANKVTLECTAPAQTIAGEAIAADAVIDIMVNGEVAAQVAPGAAVSIECEVEKPGTYTYTVIPCVGTHMGSKTSVKVYVGVDTPLDVENLTATDLASAVKLDWDKVGGTGALGGVVIPEDVVYNAYPVVMFEFFGLVIPEIDFEHPYATGLTENTVTVDYNTMEGEQGYTYFGVTAANAAGESAGAMVATLTGAPYELPMHESFTGGSLSYWWGADYDDDNYNADGGIYVSEEASDGDGFGILFDAQTAGWIELQSGKFTLAGAANPTLTFDYLGAGNGTLIVLVNGKEVVREEVVSSLDFETIAVDLKEYANDPFVRFTIRGEFEEAAQIVVDNINVLDLYEDNLVLSISAPKSVTAGQTATVTVKVQNQGQNVAEGYTVKVSANDEVIAEYVGEAIGFFETAEYSCKIETSVFDEAGDIVVAAEALYDAELKAEDNYMEAVIALVVPATTPVEGLAVEQTDNGYLLTWEAAENAASETTESFEDYEEALYAAGECGPWTAIDGDQGSTYGWSSSSINWPYTGEAYAFAIMCPATVFGDAASVTAPSGDKVLMFMSVQAPADDWMISSQLPGVAQTITFKAMPMTASYGAEVVQVMASSTDADPSSFTLVEEFELLDSENWTECSANLPEGTKYFALHYVSNDIFCLFIDDLTYVTAGSAPTGYNVYVDQQLVATLPADATSYEWIEATRAISDHTFSVTALYGDKESAPVSVSTDDITGIETITAAGEVKAYRMDGVRAQDLKSGAYIINGAKAVVK